MDRDRIRALMAEVLAAQGKSLQANESADLREIGFRSLDFSELALRVEDEVAVELNFDAPELRRITTVGDVLDFLQSLHLVKGGAAGNTRLRTGAWTGEWSDLPVLKLPPMAAVAADDHLQAALAVVSHLQSDCEVLIASATRFDSDLVVELRAAGFAIVRGLGTPNQTVEPPTAGQVAVPGIVWLLTSGSTGRPKRVRHSIQSLTTVRGEQPPRKWLCPYSHGAYAWWQVDDPRHRPSRPSTSSCMESRRDRRLARSRPRLKVGATSASGTPTFWRQAL